MKRMVLYHGNCVDGFTTAWIAWRQFGDTAEYVACNYGPAFIGPEDVAGAEVYILDFSFPREKLLRMAAAANSVTLLDHHKTAEADLAGIEAVAPPNLRVVFDMNRSGAGIAFDEFNGVTTEEPWRRTVKSGGTLVDYVEDRDLWRFKLPLSKEVNAYIGSFEQTFDVWANLSIELDNGSVDPVDRERIVSAGAAILRTIDRYVLEMSKQARMVLLGGHRIPLVNAPYINTSELVGHLAETNPESPFAAGWFQRGDGLYQYSLRSRDGFDVSEVAKQFGGGGHKAAAGFTVAERVEVA